MLKCVVVHKKVLKRCMIWGFLKQVPRIHALPLHRPIQWSVRRNADTFFLELSSIHGVKVDMKQVQSQSQVKSGGPENFSCVVLRSEGSKAGCRFGGVN